MPQVAQQDYIRIAPKAGRVLIQDAAALGQIKAAISKGTLWDCICANIQTDDNSFGKILGVHEPASVDVWDAANGKAFTLNVEFTVKQYEGLSAVQLAEDTYYEDTMGMPSLGRADDEYLRDSPEATLICVDGYKLIATENDGYLAALSISQDKPDPDNDDFVNITWEDAQKLIGLPIV